MNFTQCLSSQVLVTLLLPKPTQISYTITLPTPGQSRRPRNPPLQGWAADRVDLSALQRWHDQAPTSRHAREHRDASYRGHSPHSLDTSQNKSEFAEASDDTSKESKDSQHDFLPSLNDSDPTIISGVLPSSFGSRRLLQDIGMPDFGPDRVRTRRPTLENISPAQEQLDSSDDDTDLASVFSSRSTAYASSASSVAGDSIPGMQDTLEELALLFSEDTEISNLLNISLQRSNAQAKFVSKFRPLLKMYGNELKQEAFDGTQKAAAKLVQDKAKYVAIRIQKIWTDEWNDTSERKAVRSVRVQKFMNTMIPLHDEDGDDNQSDSTSADEESDVDTSEPQVSLKTLIEFMISSKAFGHLRQAFWRMVFPNPLRGIRDIISNAFKSSSGACTASFNVYWPVQAYVATELAYHPSLKQKDRVLNNVLTVTGVASRAYANTAEAYVRWRWPEAKVNVLELVGALLRARSKGMRTLISISQPINMNIQVTEARLSTQMTTLLISLVNTQK